MTNETKQISVCICTYKRPRFLTRLLKELGSQDTNGLSSYSILLADKHRTQPRQWFPALLTYMTVHGLR